MRARILAAAMLATAMLATAGGCERAMTHLEAMHHPKSEAHARASGPHAAQPGTMTLDLQGGYNEWKASPFLHQFYDLTRASFASGADRVDFPAYQERSYAIFRAFGGLDGGKAGEEAMLDHLKDIPRQIVGIVKDDPKVLDDYDKFWIAMAGPP